MKKTEIEIFCQKFVRIHSASIYKLNLAQRFLPHRVERIFISIYSNYIVTSLKVKIIENLKRNNT